MSKDELKEMMAKAVIPPVFPRPYVRFAEFPATFIDACDHAKVEVVISKRENGIFWVHCCQDKNAVSIHPFLKQYARINENGMLYGHYRLR